MEKQEMVIILQTVLKL